MIDIYRDPVWDIFDFLSRPQRIGEMKTKSSGLKDYIHRPHNLINIKDEDGKVIAQRLEVVTTPFNKNDVKVSITDNVLSVNCGNENIEKNDNEDIIYQSLSYQSYSFAIKLSPSINQSKISAENNDGVLKITMPLKTIEDTKPETIEIQIG